jgi:hypothetical protein
MPNLDLKIEEIKKEMSVDSKGFITFTIKGASRLSGLHENSLSFTDARLNQKLAKVLKEHGFDVTQFGSLGVPDKATSLIVEFYAFDADTPREIAKCSYRAFASVGIRQWGQELLGWKPPEQPPSSQVLLLLESLSQNMTELRQEVNTQNHRIELLLPSHEMMQEIKPALLLNDGTVLAVMKAISQNLKDFPDQKYSDIRYFLQGRNCGLGERISIGQTVSSCFKGFIGKELPTKYGYKRGNKLYPECAKPIFELVLKGMGK